jgi:hypothetical protein
MIFSKFPLMSSVIAAISFIASFQSSFAAERESVLTKKDLIGVWILEESENYMPNGEVVPYCTGSHGMIIYTKEGIVSVALNCGEVEEGTIEPANSTGRKLSYAGRFSFDGSDVTHHIMNASEPSMIGSEFTRRVELNGQRLSLSGEIRGQRFTARWIKLR